MPFGVEWSRLTALDGGPHPPKGMEVWGFYPHWFEWRFSVYFLKIEIYSTHT